MDKKYKVVRTLQLALYGDIALAEEEQSRKLVAIKRVDEVRASQGVSLRGHKTSENPMLECRVLQFLNRCGGHPNVLRIQNAFREKGYLHLVLEYCRKGDLYEIIGSAPNQRLTETQARIWFMHIVAGVQFLHSRGIAHRDISLENVLVSDNNTCKLSDFGLSTAATSRINEKVGKKLYMAPEVYSGDEYNPVLADIWSLGVVLFMMVTGSSPLTTPCERDIRFRVIKSQGVRSLLQSWKMTSFLAENATDLLSTILVVDPSLRPSTETILHHPWLHHLP